MTGAPLHEADSQRRRAERLQRDDATAAGAEQMEVAGLQSAAFASSLVAMKAVSSRLVEAGLAEHSLVARAASLMAAGLEVVQSMAAEVGVAAVGSVLAVVQVV